MPLARKREIAPRLRKRVQLAAIHANRAAVASPAWNAHMNGPLLRSRHLDVQRCSLLCRKRGLLPQPELLLLPVQFGSDELIDPDAVRIMKIDCVVELRELLRARARAAPERILRRIEVPPISRRKRKEVLLQSLRILRAHTAVPQAALVRVHPARIASPCKRVALELHQVVGHATLGVVILQAPLQVSGIAAPRLANAGIADHVAALGQHLFKKILRDVTIARLSGQLVHPRRADHLGHMCVRV